ncbi:cytochrome P450 CYP82D47-like [Pyrus ussuriensis x Pyrus communis]|uniref:Cytochrome P450 CYP82D47-like n=1 Tax=Pyrus ussuriensis x Pyrus communis TaxID=2448454 RepID=A0A5N5GWJ8_9ROSA|nr:cytochrome P450 CYP82D47-like [Pyrus ussuriensis x Pyrus communis]KAB2619678.1 cytochrome P450 CYP82D47-like [Pyrus ussuriensis x Pyrus communis]
MRCFQSGQDVAQYTSLDVDTIMKAIVLVSNNLTMPLQNIIAGGSDTTTILMVCALNKVQEELDNYVG